jgi:DNA mismatch repair protein MutL
MDNPIRILSVDLANKIAAGEVVERPASVVKELVENAIDAGATRISIEIEQGGLLKILITDNGSGISAHDAPLALERHATSKISQESDLFAIHTLGFRGEALPSIASVSKFQLLTRRDEDLVGTRVSVESGQQTIEEAAAPKGTRVLVENLFYNTPARLKFMKSVVSEGGHVLQTCIHLALTRPDIAFQCMRDDKLVLDTEGNGKLMSVIQSIYGRNVVEHLLPVDYSDSEYSLKGYIGKPTFPRSNRRDGHFIINGRYAMAPSIQHAVEDSYRQRMEPRKYPFFVLLLELPLEHLDVNVHPAKTEVRFQEDRRVYSLVQRGVQSALNPLVETTADLNNNWRKPVQTEKKDSWPVSSNPWTEIKIHETVVPQVFNPVREHPPIEEQPTLLRKQAAFESFKASIFPPLRPISQLAGTYILAQSVDTLYIFDQHAMAERILYNQLKNQFNNGEIQRQILLEPYSLHFTIAEYDRVLARLEDLKTLGFDLEDFGNQTLLVREIPQAAGGLQGKEQIQQLFLELSNQERSLKNSDLMLKTLVTMSCKGSVKANQWLPQQQMLDFVDQLGRCEDASTCPHGRPTYYKMSVNDLDKFFKRVTP